MRFIMAPFVVFALLATSLVAQESVETFNSIRLEDPSTPGNYFTLAPSAGMTPYRCEWSNRINGVVQGL
jgi:hypothetical protein